MLAIHYFKYLRISSYIMVGISTSPVHRNFHFDQKKSHGFPLRHYKRDLIIFNYLSSLLGNYKWREKVFILKVLFENIPEEISIND